MMLIDMNISILGIQVWSLLGARISENSARIDAALNVWKMSWKNEEINYENGAKGLNMRACHCGQG
jgi:hypothetical protein